MSGSSFTLQALIFDVDGTLADTERDGHRPAFNAAFREAGLDWEWDEALYGELLAVTGGKERIAHFVARHRPDFAQRPDYAEQVAALHKAKTRHYTQLAASGSIPLRPGVARLLAEARSAGLRLAVATTTTPENVSALLVPALGPDAMAWFEVIGAGDVVPAKKPAPDIYLWVLERLGLPASACLAFEDSENGLRASLGAGLATVVTPCDYAQKDRRSRPEEVLLGYRGGRISAARRPSSTAWKGWQSPSCGHGCPAPPHPSHGDFLRSYNCGFSAF